MRYLYSFEDSRLSDDDLFAALRDAGVAEGDILFVHSDISAFGKLIASKDAFLSGIVETLERAVGSGGTIIMPTFNYAFCKGEPYDVARTRSMVGALTEYFRTAPGVSRSRHPIFSVAAWGAGARELLDVSMDSYGHGCVFEKLLEKKGKILLLGVSLETCSFLHYVEQMHQVPYRFEKSFTGTIIDGDRSYEATAISYVRSLDGSAENDMSRIEPLLRSSGSIRQARFGAGTLMLVSADEVYRIGMEMLDADPTALLRKSPDAA